MQLESILVDWTASHAICRRTAYAIAYSNSSFVILFTTFPASVNKRVDR